MARHKRSSHAESAYKALREMAKTFEFKPGERLNELELAARLKMSRSPIREALNRLSTEGLLVWRPNQGFFCRQLRVREIRSLCEIRLDLELGAIRSTIKAADKGALKKIKKFWREVVAKAASLTNEELVGYDEEFHLMLARAADNEVRVRFLEHINAHLNFVRRINLEIEERRQQTITEHNTIIDEIIGGHATKAEEYLRKHLMMSADQALEVLPTGLLRIYSD